MAESGGYRIVRTVETRLSPYVVLADKLVAADDWTEPRSFHSLRQFDYVNVLAIAPDGRVPFVRQYRPALDRYTIELPGGLRDDPQEEPPVTAARELYEETGLVADDVRLLACLDPDSGRLENKFWAYFAPTVTADQNWRPEAGVEPMYMSRSEIMAAIEGGRLTHAGHLAIIGLCMMRGLLS